MERSIQMLVSKQEIRDVWLLLGEQYITNDPAINGSREVFLFGKRASYRNLGICTALRKLYSESEMNFTTWAMMENTIDKDLDALGQISYFCSPYIPESGELRGMYCLLMAEQCMENE